MYINNMHLFLYLLYLSVRKRIDIYYSLYFRATSRSGIGFYLWQPEIANIHCGFYSAE